MVSRMVYYCFVAAFDLDDIHYLNVVMKDGDGLRVEPDNLLLVTSHEKCQRTFDAGRLPAPFEMYPDTIEKAVKASITVTSKQVSQYDTEGKLIQTFDSIEDACRATGISHSVIAKSMNDPTRRCHDFYWRLGDEPSIDTQILLQNWRLHYRKAAGKEVTRFDIEGNPLEHYSAISEAARDVGISHKSISDCIKGVYSHAGGFRWKLGHYTAKLPPLKKGAD